MMMQIIMQIMIIVMQIMMIMIIVMQIMMIMIIVMQIMMMAMLKLWAPSPSSSPASLCLDIQIVRSSRQFETAGN